MTKVSFLGRRRFLKRVLAGGACLCAGTGFYTWRVEPHWVEVVRRALPITGLPDAMCGRTLVQLSDLHVGPEVEDDYLIGAFRRVAGLEPDVLVLTGDFMTCRAGEQVEHTLRVLEHLRPARLAALGILGNHDYGVGWKRPEVADRLAAGLAGLGIDVLRNETRDVHGLTVAGLDDLWCGRFQPKKVLPGLDPKGANLVLVHNPDAADEPGWHGYKGWVLCGHTHGGQCRPPFLPPPILPVKNRRYTAGEIDLDDGRRMYINRALGHLRSVRFNVRPEITVFTLRREGERGV
jgi:predicted MPP superfamily phosphohydrolase